MDPTVITIIAVVVVLAGFGAFLFLRSRSFAKQEEEYFHFNCPGCRRKLRYRARQAGHAGKCPRCDTTLTFPGGKK